MTASYQKLVKEADVLLEIKDAYDNSTPKEIEGKLKKAIKKALNGEERIIVGKNGFFHIPLQISEEINKTFQYSTKSRGAHFWIKYTGKEILKNTSTKFGLDLRVGAKGNNCGGYVKYNNNVDIRECEHLIKESSSVLNRWLENLFK